MSINPQSSPNLSIHSALGRLFAPGVIVIERRLPGDPAELLPNEAHYVAGARLKRKQEFAAGRSCARAALAKFGVRGYALPMAEDRQPLWPDGFIGSITHTAGLCAAAVSTRQRVLALGLDSEVVGAPTPDIWSTLCRAEELAWVKTLPSRERPAAVTLVFSAKESFYKCQYPLVAEWLDFHDLHIEMPEWGDPEASFTVRAMRNIRFGARAAMPVTGRYAFHEEFVSAGVTILADQ